MGTRALNSHAQGKKHQNMVLHVAKGTPTLKDYLKKPEETEASTLKLKFSLVHHEYIET